MGGSTGQGELDSAGVKVGALRGFSEEVTMGLSMKDGRDRLGSGEGIEREMPVAAER